MMLSRTNKIKWLRLPARYKKQKRAGKPWREPLVCWLRWYNSKDRDSTPETLWSWAVPWSTLLCSFRQCQCSVIYVLLACNNSYYFVTDLVVCCSSLLGRNTAVSLLGYKLVPLRNTGWAISVTVVLCLNSLGPFSAVHIRVVTYESGLSNSAAWWAVNLPH